jgi:hypothetical protein
MLSAIRPPEHGTAESCRIAETLTVPKTADQAPEYQEHEEPTALRLNKLLEVPSMHGGAESLPHARENYDIGGETLLVVMTARDLRCVERYCLSAAQARRSRRHVRCARTSTQARRRAGPPAE